MDEDTTLTIGNRGQLHDSVQGNIDVGKLIWRLVQEVGHYAPHHSLQV